MLAKAIRLRSASQTLMSETALPVSVSITPQQLAWLDERRRHGSLSRSAALRQVLDAAICRESLLDAVAPEQTPSALPAIQQW